MRTDTALRVEAMNVLEKAFGAVEAERFISLVKRDSFDYTEWRRGLWNEMTIDEVYDEASSYNQDHSFVAEESVSYNKTDSNDEVDS